MSIKLLIFRLLLGLSLFGIWTSLPSRLVLFRDFIITKISTGDALCQRGYHLPSVCSLCWKDQEIMEHIFFICPFPSKCQNWFFSIIGKPINQNLIQILNICGKLWNNQCRDVIQSPIVRIINTIWYYRNQARFYNHFLHQKKVLNLINAYVSFIGNTNSKTYNSSMLAYSINKNFIILIHPHRDPKFQRFYGILLVGIG